ncbi:MAG: chemotaxis protein CheW [Hyphomicrobium sp.]
MLNVLEKVDSTSDAAEAQKCFTVYCAGEIFGLSVNHAQTIFRVTSVTPIPLGRPEIVGLVNLRGKIVTAVSLRQRLRLPSDQSHGNFLAIGIERNGENFALIVDQVGDVIELDASMQIPVPAHFDPQRSQMTSGLYRVGNKLVPILDMDAILDFERQ